MVEGSRGGGGGEDQGVVKRRGEGRSRGRQVSLEHFPDSYNIAETWTPPDQRPRQTHSYFIAPKLWVVLTRAR